MAAVTQRQIGQLAPYLEGGKPTHLNQDGTREWNLLCPLHDDSKRSASLNIDKGLFYCNVCGGMSTVALIRRKDEWREAGSSNGHHPNLNGTPSTRPKRQLNEGLIEGWHSALMSNKPALAWLKEKRGLLPKTLINHEIGLLDGRLYTIPVRGFDGEIWNVRYYNPRPEAEARKIWSESGYGSPPRLFPVSVLADDPSDIIIGGGEWDILLTLQSDFVAITRTAGEDFWDASWNEYFANRVVYLAHDADEKGQKANRVVGRALARIADVRVLKLPYPVVAKHGKDLTDLLLDHGANGLHEAKAAAQPFNKTRGVAREVETVSVLDTHDARRLGKPVRVVVTVKGRKEPGYTVPKRIRLACTQDVGQKCVICPMRAAPGGETVIDVAPDDPVVLSMIEHPTGKMNKTVAEAYGVPGGRCVKLVQEVEEYQAVEILFARPALDQSEGWDTRPEAAQYKTIKLTSVGRHDTPPNNTVSVVGALQPNPETQGNEFLVHELRQMETSVDRFELNGDTVKLMKRFQGKQPLRKVAEINKALAEHVTRIHGRPEMHALIDLTFHSVLSFKFAGELINRGWLESLIIGDTRTGKSLAAQRLVQHYGAGEIISCEAASFAGVIGGLQQLGGRDWVVTWGVVPVNDRRLVVLDEISGLTPEEIAQMSDVRSSGQAKLVKIQQESTWARTRLLWLGNPRNTTMSNYTYGVDAIKPLIGNAEDIARFDLAMAVTLSDVASEVINQPTVGGELRYTAEACHALLMWVWTRGVDQVVFGKTAERKIFDQANELGKLYVEDPPLIQAANIRIKIARLAAALAARTFSTDSTCEKIIVLPEHVDAAVQFINLLYGMKAFGYRERSKEQLADRLEAERNKGEMEKYLRSRPILAKFLRTTGKFRRQDLEEIMSVSREEAIAVISTLYENRMVRKQLGDIVVEPTLHTLLREVR